MSDIDISEPLSDMLAPLNNEQKEFLMNNYTIQTYKKNETIYCEGETPSHLMCLINGKVKIFKDGVGGRSQIIRMIKPHEYFAYRAYFAKEDFVTAAAAFEPSVVCLIPMSAIMTLVTQNNDLAMFFIRQLSIDLGISDERTVSKPDPKTHSRTFSRISDLLERKLWTGRRRLYPKYLLIT